MKRNSHRRIKSCVLFCLFATLAGFGPANAGNQDAAKADDPRELARRQLELANRALGLIDRSAKIGAPVSDAATDVHAWSYRRLSARLFLSFGPDERGTMDPEVYLFQAEGPPNPDRITAFEEHRALMKNWEERFRGLARTGIGSQFNYLTFQAHLLQAENWLARERNRKPGRTKP